MLPTTKLLGVTLDRGATFRHHAAEVNARARSRLNVLKALTATTFGHTKESITALYKQFVRPVLSYASPAWAPDLAQSHMEVLQRTQNAALRIATGCVRSTPTAHLHAETLVLPIRDHLDMRGAQTIESAKCPDHPLHQIHLPPTGRRRQIHTTPGHYYGALCASIPPPPPRRSPGSWLHQHFVLRSLESAPPNSLLHEVPPTISTDERSLPRADRVHLSRLRCGHHPSLLSYECRVRPDTDPACRWCGSVPEDLPHLLLTCSALEDPRNRWGITSLRDLWERPAASLAFLRDAGVIRDPH